MSEIRIAAASIVESLKSLRLRVPENLADIVMNETDIVSELRPTRIDVAQCGLMSSGLAKSEIAFRAMKAIHNHRRSDPVNEQRYFDMSRENERFMFLDAELIGFERLMEYYPSVDQVLRALCIVTERHELLQVWSTARNRFQRDHHLRTREDLMGYVMRASQPLLSVAIRRSMEYPPNAEAIVGQILRENSILPNLQTALLTAGAVKF